MRAIGEYISGKCITLSPFTRAANFYNLRHGSFFLGQRRQISIEKIIAHSLHGGTILYIGGQMDPFSHSGAIQLANIKLLSTFHELATKNVFLLHEEI